MFIKELKIIYKDKLRLTILSLVPEVDASSQLTNLLKATFEALLDKLGAFKASLTFLLSFHNDFVCTLQL